MRRKSSIFDMFAGKPAEESSAAARRTSLPRPASAAKVAGVDVSELFESERWRDQIGWSAKNLELDDPRPFSWAWSGTGAGGSDSFISPAPPDGFQYLGIWEIDTTAAEEGWMYARNFGQFSSAPAEGSVLPLGVSPVYNTSHRVRRRRWIRDVQPMAGRQQQGGAASSAADSDSDEDSVATSSDYGGSQSGGGGEKSLFLKLGSLGLTGSVGGIASSLTLGRQQNMDEDEFSSSAGGGDLSAKQALASIGRQMRELELECAREAEAVTKEWKKNHYPQYKMQVKELEKSLEGLQAQLTKNNKLSESDVISLEDTINAHTEALNATKKRLYFPHSSLSFGTNGIFVAIDDVWIERVSGVFVVDLIGSLTAPQVIVVLTGTESGPGAGVNINLKLEGFKLRAPGAPKISLDEAVLTACVRVTMMLTFHAESNKWKMNNEDLSIKLNAFSGPYGLSRTLVSTVLSIVSSKIRHAILDAVPVEIGHLLRTLPIPFSIRGEFDIEGNRIKELSLPVSEATGLCRTLGLSMDHLAHFMKLQKLLDRSSSGKMLKTIQDMINYRIMGAKHPRHWDRLKKLWTQAVTIYIEMKMEQLATVAFTSSPNPTAVDSTAGGDPPAGGAVNKPAEMSVIATLNFDDLMQAIEDCMRKPMSVKFKLHHLAGQISVNQIVLQLKKLAQRFAKMKLINIKQKKPDDDDESTTKDNRLMVLLKRATASFEIAEYVLKVLSRNFDYGQVLARVTINSGSNSMLKIRAKEIVARAPISIWLNLPQRLAYFGIFCPISYVLAMKTDPDGSFIMEFNHVGSPSGVRRGAFLNVEDEKDRRQNKRRGGPSSKATWRGKWIAALSKAKIEQSSNMGTIVRPPTGSTASSEVIAARVKATSAPAPSSSNAEVAEVSQALQSVPTPISLMSNDFQRFSQRAFAVANKAIEEVNNAAQGKGGPFNLEQSVMKVLGAGSNASSAPSPHASSATASTPGGTTRQVAGSPLVKAHSSSFSMEAEVNSVSLTSTDSSYAAPAASVMIETLSARSRAETITTDGGSSIAGTPPQPSKMNPDYFRANATRTPTMEADRGKAAASEVSPTKKGNKLPVLRSYIRRRRLEHTLKQTPKDLEVVEVASVVVSRPKITMVTEKAVSLRAGAELFTFSLGKSSTAGVDSDKKQVNIEGVVQAPRVAPSSPKKERRVMKQGSADSGDDDDLGSNSSDRRDSFDSELNGGSIRAPILNQLDLLEDTLVEEYKDSGLDMPESLRNIIGTFDGAPVVVQTGSGIKIVAEIPKVNVNISMVDLIRFVNVLLASPELRVYLGARNQNEEEELDELLAFIKAVFARAGKYFLLPGLKCGLHILGKLVVVDDEVVIKIETPDEAEDEEAAVAAAVASARSAAAGGEGGGGAGAGADGARDSSFAEGEYDEDGAGGGEGRNNRFVAAQRERVLSLEDPEEAAWTSPAGATATGSAGGNGSGAKDNTAAGKARSGKGEDGESSSCAAYVMMSLNLMDLLEDHTVISSLLNDYIFSYARRNMNSSSK